MDLRRSSQQAINERQRVRHAELRPGLSDRLVDWQHSMGEARSHLAEPAVESLSLRCVAASLEFDAAPNLGEHDDTISLVGVPATQRAIFGCARSRFRISEMTFVSSRNLKARPHATSALGFEGTRLQRCDRAGLIRTRRKRSRYCRRSARSRVSLEPLSPSQDRCAAFRREPGSDLHRSSEPEPRHARAPAPRRAADGSSMLFSGMGLSRAFLVLSAGYITGTALVRSGSCYLFAHDCQIANGGPEYNHGPPGSESHPVLNGAGPAWSMLSRSRTRDTFQGTHLKVTSRERRCSRSSIGSG